METRWVNVGELRVDLGDDGITFLDSSDYIPPTSNKYAFVALHHVPVLVEAIARHLLGEETVSDKPWRVGGPHLFSSGQGLRIASWGEGVYGEGNRYLKTVWTSSLPNLLAEIGEYLLRERNGRASA